MKIVKAMRKAWALVMLITLFPLVVLSDRLFGFIVTGVECTFSETVRRAYAIWLNDYWRRP